MLVYAVEFLGSLLFLSVVLATEMNAFLVAITLFAVTILGRSISGAHYNPAMSVMRWAMGELSVKDLGLYVGSQVAGGLAALGLWKAFLSQVPMNSYTFTI